MIQQSDKPNFMVIGAQKAASTALLAALRTHPQVWMPEQEDPFLRDPVFESDVLPRFFARYAGREEPFIGLKCPDYLARPEVPERISNLLGRTKLIVILRDPVERAISAYFWHVRWGALPIEDPNDGLRRVIDGSYRTIDPTVDDILEWGLYARHISRYLDHFARDSLLILDDRAFRKDREAVLATTLEFLGADPTLPTSSPAYSNEGVYSLPRLRFLQLRNGVILKWNDEHSYFTIFKPRNLALRGYSNLIAATDRWVLAKVFGNRKPLIDPNVRAALENYYREDAAALQTLLPGMAPSWRWVQEGAEQ